MKQFRAVRHIEINGTPFAEVAPKREMIFVGLGHEETDCFTVDEARQLRDWLTTALPCEHKGPRHGELKWNEPSTMTCDECGAEVPSFYTTQN
jgi:hypothetical protein